MLDKAKCFTDLNKRRLGDHVWLARGGGGIRGETCHIIPSTFSFFKKRILGWGSCVWVKGTFFFFPGDDFSLFFFPKDQGQEESTPRVVGGKKNNKAHECLGTTALLTSSIIISAWLGCLGNLHNTILTPSLQLSITTTVEFSFLAHACLLSVSPLVSLSHLPFFFLLLFLPLLLPFCMFTPLFLPLSMCAGQAKKKGGKR